MKQNSMLRSFPLASLLFALETKLHNELFKVAQNHISDDQIEWLLIHLVHLSSRNMWVKGIWLKLSVGSLDVRGIQVGVVFCLDGTGGHEKL